MTDPSTWALRCQVFRETDLYDGFSLKGRSELFFLQPETFKAEKVILATQQDYFCVARLTSSLKGCGLFSVMW